MVKMCNDGKYTVRDLSGQKFNMWTVLSFDSIKNGKAYWLCKCECGTTKVVCGTSLTKNTRPSKSCGCLRSTTRHSIKHGFKGTRFYNIWNTMKQRCFNKNKDNYMYYGGRGISVCDNWLDFINFKNDMYESYIIHLDIFDEKNTTIDRIDFNKNYCKENCKWSTLSEQNKNKRR